MSGPERIWAWYMHPSMQNEHMEGGWTETPDKRETLYIRHDALERLVERAFRDGLTYGSICEVSDPDAAWQSSAARAALAKIGGE